MHCYTDKTCIFVTFGWNKNLSLPPFVLLLFKFPIALPRESRLITIRISHVAIVNRSGMPPAKAIVKFKSRHAGDFAAVRETLINGALIAANFIARGNTRVHLHLSSIEPPNAEHRVHHRWASTRIVRPNIYPAIYAPVFFLLITLDKISLCLSISQRAQKSTKLIILYHYSSCLFLFLSPSVYLSPNLLPQFWFNNHFSRFLRFRIWLFLFFF